MKSVSFSNPLVTGFQEIPKDEHERKNRYYQEFQDIKTLIKLAYDNSSPFENLGQILNDVSELDVSFKDGRAYCQFLAVLRQYHFCNSDTHYVDYIRLRDAFLKEKPNYTNYLKVKLAQLNDKHA
tara:strand:- start:2759 stop:3133 length:375 start_codon:yes stop_codon:yes gene_type:complete